MTTQPDRHATVVAAFTAALIPVSIVASRGIVVLLVAAALGAAAVAWRARRPPRAPGRAVAALIVALLVWATTTALWSVTPVGSLALAARLAALVAAGLLLHGVVETLNDAARARAGRWLVGGFVAGLAFVAAEVALGFPIFMAIKPELSSAAEAQVRFNRGATAMVMVCWVAAAVPWRAGRRWAALALPAGLGLLLPFLSSLSAGLGLLAGAATAALALTHRRAGRAVLIAAVLAAFIGSPIAAKTFYAWDWQDARWLPLSAEHRVEIWHKTLQRIEERPILGWGLDSARVISRMPTEIEPSGRSPAGLHPHNAPLQILEELGLVGWSLALALLIAVALRIERLPAPSRVFAQATFVSALAMSCTAYGIWQGRWLGLFLAVGALVPLAAPGPRPDIAPD